MARVQDSSTLPTQDAPPGGTQQGAASLPPAQMGGRVGGTGGEEHWTGSPGLGCESSPMPCALEAPASSSWASVSPPGRWGWGGQGGLRPFSREDTSASNCRAGGGYVQGHSPAWAQRRVDTDKVAHGLQPWAGAGPVGGHHRGEGLGVLARPSFPAGARGSWLPPRLCLPPTFLPLPPCNQVRAFSNRAQKLRGRKPKHGTSLVV